MCVRENLNTLSNNIKLVFNNLMLESPKPQKNVYTLRFYAPIARETHEMCPDHTKPV